MENPVCGVTDYTTGKLPTKNVNKVCLACGLTANYLTCLKKYGKPPIKKSFDCSTFHTAVCDVCGEKTSVTEPRDFFYPDFELIFKKIK